MNKERLQYLLQQFANGRISRAEYDELVSQVQLAEAEATIDEGMSDVWEQLKQHAAFNDMPNERMYQAIITDERFQAAPVYELPGSAHPRKWLRSWRQLAASILVIGCTATLYFVFNPFKRQPVAQKISWKKLTATAGERRQFTLPDSSAIWLNAGSTLLYDNTFNTGSREVFLEGEAFFDVVTNKASPFIVHTGKISTKVVGTAFDIQAYAAQPLTVTVLRGKVAVSKKDTSLALLTPNKQLHYTPSENEVAVSDVNAENFIAWKNGELIFDNTSMQQAADIISRWYNVEVVFKNPRLKKCRLTVSFLKGEKLAEVMNVISGLNDFTCEVTGHQVIMGGKGCY